MLKTIKDQEEHLRDKYILKALDEILTVECLSILLKSGHDDTNSNCADQRSMKSPCCSLLHFNPTLMPLHAVLL